MSQGQPEPIKNTIEEVLKKISKTSLIEEGAQLIKEWNKIVGKRISQHAMPVKIENATLIINVESSSWLFELQTKYKTNLLKKIQKSTKMPKIKNIRFRIGETKDGN